MPLSQAEQDYRRDRVTGSLVNALMAATTEAELIALWRIKIGLDPPEPENWAMRVGSHMEPLILDWVSQTAQSPITRRGEIVDHPTVPNVAVKLDGYRSADDAVIEVKFLSPWRSSDEFVGFYYPQCLLQKLCTGARNMRLVTAQGTSEPVEHELEYSEDYATEMMRRVEAFLHCMRTLTPPYPEPPIIPPSKWRTVDLAVESPNWRAEMMENLAVYDDLRPMADACEAAAKAARGLVPPDVGKIINAGTCTLSRNKNGAVSINRRK